ncbi:hypothetical protein KL86PLE_41232 [uncultured Pleomorphomonas sp.]|uniref:Uncharacterized protein n=1 Tax=uncultured Pleomorphomonas sp. TaxID=442121 RepID=A0A212LIX0_9HYPH|nr:hypothetical protein KL86PLE_41232 [uncultured Pleomorphomonas sp.]
MLLHRLLRAALVFSPLGIDVTLRLRVEVLIVLSGPGETLRSARKHRTEKWNPVFGKSDAMTKD